jgi:hypothetical protein
MKKNQEGTCYDATLWRAPPPERLTQTGDSGPTLARARPIWETTFSLHFGEHCAKSKAPSLTCVSSI